LWLRLRSGLRNGAHQPDADARNRNSEFSAESVDCVAINLYDSQAFASIRDFITGYTNNHISRIWQSRKAPYFQILPNNSMVCIYSLFYYSSAVISLQYLSKSASPISSFRDAMSRPVMKRCVCPKMNRSHFCSILVLERKHLFN